MAAMNGFGEAISVGLLASAAERLLADEAERALRAPRGRLALVVHLSLLPAPGLGAHHARVARALLQDVGQRHGGQVFAMRNNDMVLLCAAPQDSGAPQASSPLALPALLGRLFGMEGAAAGRLTSLWRLETGAAELRRYIAARHSAHGAAVTPPEPGGGDTASAAALIEVLATAPLAELMSQQTAIQLLPGRGLPIAARLTPLFRELTTPLTALTARGALEDGMSDPYLFRHVAARLDARMLDLLEHDLASGGRLTRPALRQRLQLFLNLTVQSIVSPAFSQFARTAKRAGLSVGVEVALADATADLELTEHARSLLDAVGFALLLDGVGHTELTMARVEALLPALVKLRWQAVLAQAGPAMLDGIDAAIARIGVDRVILARADSEAALLWGQARGITRFQGYFLDAVQAAARIAVCHSARACTLRQCVTRAGTANQATRTECGNPALLDTAPQGLGGARQSAAVPA